MSMKSADEIKKGLDCCADGNIVCAGNCIFDDDDKLVFPDCKRMLMTNALSLIQQLQADNAEKAERIRVLESRNNALYHTILGVMHSVDKWLDVPAYDPDEDLNGTTAVGRASHAREIALQAIEQLEAERDAAIAELANSDRPCDFCKYLKKFAHETPCNNCVHVLHGEESQFKWRGVQKEDSDAVSS